MLTFKRALVISAFALTVLYLLTRSHDVDAHPQSSFSGPDHPSDEESRDGTSRQPSTPSPATDDDAPPQRVMQKPSAVMSNMPLEQKLAYQYPYDLETRFPAYIWQTWKYTPADEQFNFREQEATWTEEHPGFVHEVITDDVAVNLLRLLYSAVPEVLEAYDALPLPVLKADFFRYLILLARGGIYSDIDTYAIRSAVEWIPSTVSHQSVGLVIGIEADPDRDDWQEWYSRRIQFCQWTIQSKPGHPVMREIVSHITRETLKKKKEGTLTRDFPDKNVIEFTGPAVWTDIIFAYFNDERYFDMKHSPGLIDSRNFTGMEMPKKVGDVLVLPITSFSPGVQQMGAKEYDDPMAFVKHDFEGSWKPEELRHIGEQKEEEN